MKKLLSIIILGLLWGNISYSNPNNPTDEWLADKTVNQLIQEYGYKLFSITPTGSSTTVYTLINRKIVVSCVVASGNPKMKLYCFLP